MAKGWRRVNRWVCRSAIEPTRPRRLYRLPTVYVPSTSIKKKKINTQKEGKKGHRACLWLNPPLPSSLYIMLLTSVFYFYFSPDFTRSSGFNRRSTTVNSYRNCYVYLF